DLFGELYWRTRIILHLDAYHGRLPADRTLAQLLYCRWTNKNFSWATKEITFFTLTMRKGTLWTVNRIFFFCIHSQLKFRLEHQDHEGCPRARCLPNMYLSFGHFYTEVI
ncbi:hypothetical protein GDO81_028762, partial [Engystomops pustulosus]